MGHVPSTLLVIAALAAPAVAQQTQPDAGRSPAVVKDGWDWPEAMQQVASRFGGTEGVVLHIGDSITYANPYGAWARYGQGQTASDNAALQWMHTGKGNDLDGWWLAAQDQPTGRSFTAASGMRLDQALEGGFHGLPSIRQMLEKYNPQIVVLMLGSNDLSQNRPVGEYRADLQKAVDLILANDTVLILSTLPPMVGRQPQVRQYNETIVEVARRNRLPLIDYYGEMLSRRPGDTWQGTLISDDGVHPTAHSETVKAGDAPTPENLRNSGYLLRGWLSVQKIKEVKQKVIDAARKGPAAPATQGSAAIVQDDWNWPEKMQAVARQFTGTPGVVLHVGDSITIANPYGQWARHGQGRSESDMAVLQWMHTGKQNELDGWWLAATEVRQDGRMTGGSYTAAGGMRVNQALAGGHGGLPPLCEIIRNYNPQIVVFMLGTNDASAQRPVAEYRADIEKVIDLVLGNGTILVLSTIPPHIHRQDLARQYNQVLVDLARKHGLPLIDYYGHIVSRRPGLSWNGTLMNHNDVHPSANFEGATAASAPTPENLAKSGYLLRGWLSVQKIKEVKQKVIDAMNGQPAAGGEPEQKD